MRDRLNLLRASLSERYQVQYELGRGGNAVVYLARDLKHDRNVALKVLLPELALAVRAERFLREIQIAAKLTHPHILPLHDSGNANGTLFYVMPYVEGESLRDRLIREKQLQTEVAINIARDVASALGHAHAEGVIHRDIKPENILLTKGGEALVADFGIARALTVAGDEGVTESGIAVGTPAYMSPEQGSGEAVDGRSDIYSLGCVLYEMLAGRPPFLGSNAQEILGRHAMDQVPSVRSARNAVPVAVEQTISKALAKQPSDRFTTATEFAQALSRGAPVRKRIRRPFVLGAGSVLAIVLLLATPLIRNQLFPARRGVLVAVLNCTNLTNIVENKYLSQGVAEDLIRALSQLPGVGVSAPPSSFALETSPDPVADAGRKLGATHVVHCTVRQVGDRIRVSAGLVKVSDQRELWSDSYDRNLSRIENLFDIQAQISRAIAGSLQVSLGGVSPPRPQTTSVQAYQLYKQGRYLWNLRTLDGFREAIELYQQAIKLDSTYALAYSGLADALWNTIGTRGADQPWWDSVLSMSRNERLAWEEKAARRAIELDDGLAEGHASLGSARLLAEDDEETEREFRRAIQLDSSYAWVHVQYCWWLATRGRLEEGVREARAARRFEPTSSSSNPATALLLGHQFEEAAEAARSAIAISPAYNGGHVLLARSLLGMGRPAEAIPEFEEALQMTPESARRAIRGWIGLCYARLGRRAEAIKILASLEREFDGTDPTPNQAQGSAAIHVGLGENEAAIRVLLRAKAKPGEPRLSAQGIQDPAFDPIKSDPRYLELLKASGFRK